MTSIPLSTVVAFLRPRGALGVLEGAPFFYAHEAAAPHLRSVNLRELTQIGAVERVAMVMLYLGDGEICPAAEGWAARVLGLALNARTTHVYNDARGRVCAFNGGRLECQWWWPDDEAVAVFREQRMVGPMPATPAARLAAVLRYEMERVK